MGDLNPPFFAVTRRRPLQAGPTGRKISKDRVRIELNLQHFNKVTLHQLAYGPKYAPQSGFEPEYQFNGLRQINNLFPCQLGYRGMKVGVPGLETGSSC